MSRAGEVLELLNFNATLHDIDYNFVLNSIRAVDPAYAAAEFLWYMSGTDEIDMLCAYAPSYQRFSDDGKHAYGAYGPRIMRSLTAVIAELRYHSDTRQAVLPIWNERDPKFAGETRDLPCTVALQFFIREGALHCITYMRSNDMWLGMPYDVFCFTMLQRLIADELGCDYGAYHHHVGSMHVYEKNRLPLLEAISFNVKQPTVAQQQGHKWDHRFLLSDVQTVIQAETKLRGEGFVPPPEVNRSAANDLYVCCYNKMNRCHDEKLIVMPHSPLLQRATNIKYGL